jgi:hypothetical protein
LPFADADADADPLGLDGEPGGVTSLLPDLRREKNFVNLDLLLDGDSGEWIPAAAAAAAS